MIFGVDLYHTKVNAATFRSLFFTAGQSGRNRKLQQFNCNEIHKTHHKLEYIRYGHTHFLLMNKHTGNFFGIVAYQAVGDRFKCMGGMRGIPLRQAFRTVS